MSLTTPWGHAPRYRLVFLLLAGACLALPASAQNDREAVLHTNRLIDSNNPYLLQHAHNPVDWYPWGAEAFQRAKRDNKPIFLSIGYSTCYWCQVAERTLFSNPEIAGMMNEWFVSIKVDREERPDVDAVYLLATQLISGGVGGWPNNVFLTPDLEPFYAGGYFPPADDDSGRPGFRSVLAALHDEWVHNPERLRQRAQGVVEALRRMQASATASPQLALEPRAWLTSARASVLKRFDTEHGGLAGARQSTKFPQSPALGLMLTDYRLGRDAETLRFLTVTLDAMADGGLYDQLGGGFHRYSTERTWSIPHFEKMLYDNAQLLSVYLEAWKLTGRPQYKRIAQGVRDYLRRQMMSPQGGFYTAEDAAIEGVEGVTYLWTRPEIEAALGSDAERFLEVYALTPMPNPEDPLYPDAAPGVLRLRTSGGDHRDALEAKLVDLDRQRRELLRVRNARPQPARDEKLLVGLNGLAIEAFAASGAALHSKTDLADADRAARHLWKLAWRGEAAGLAHAVFRDRAQGEGFVDDYALLGVGFLALYESTGDKTWLRRARTLADALLRRFDPDGDGMLAPAVGSPSLILAPPEQGDEAYPSGRSAALTLLARLGKTTGDKRYTAAAKRIARQLRGPPERSPTLVAAANVNVLDDGPRAAAHVGTVQPGDQTAAHVRVSGLTRVRATYDEIVIKLDIEQGFHVNANPASFDFLIPTTVTFAEIQPLEVRYAPPRSFRPSFAPDALDVYEGQVEVVARVSKDALAKVRTLKAAITAQACTATVCLLPSQMPLTVRVRRAP